MVLIGDDPWSDSTQVPADSRYLCKHIYMPVMEPSSNQELKDWIDLGVPTLPRSEPFHRLSRHHQPGRRRRQRHLPAESLSRLRHGQQVYDRHRAHRSGKHRVAPAAHLDQGGRHAAPVRAALRKRPPQRRQPHRQRPRKSALARRDRLRRLRAGILLSATRAARTGRGRPGADPQARHQLSDRSAVGGGIFASRCAAFSSSKNAAGSWRSRSARSSRKLNQNATAANRTNVWGKEFPAGLKGIPSTRGLNPSILIEHLAPLGKFFHDPNLAARQRTHRVRGRTGPQDGHVRHSDPAAHAHVLPRLPASR